MQTIVQNIKMIFNEFILIKSQMFCSRAEQVSSFVCQHNVLTYCNTATRSARLSVNKKEEEPLLPETPGRRLYGS